MKGLIFRSTGSWYEVLHTESHKFYSARLAGKLKLDKSDLTNPVAVGDEVEMEMENDDQCIISKIYPRKNYIIRQSPKNKHQMHLIASNIDQALLVSTLKEPSLKPGFIDRFLITTEAQNIPCIIVINKSDLFEEEDHISIDELKSVYENIGYKILCSSTITGEGIDELKSLLSNKITLISGQSGVGKSSLLNSLDDQLVLKTGEISAYSGKGTHTTTFAEMHELHFGGYIIDTPGIKSLGFNSMEIMDIAHNFKELFETSQHCKFGAQCTHRNEPDCAVKQAIEEGKIHSSRYMNYLSILDEIESQNYWERKKF